MSTDQTQRSNHTRIDRLNLKGDFLSVFADKCNVYFFFRPSDAPDEIQVYVTDKYLEVDYKEVVSMSEKFSELTNIKFTRPYLDNDTKEYTFIGFGMDSSGSWHRFEIHNYNSTMTEVKEFTPNLEINLLTCLDDVCVLASIRKHSKLFYVGVDNPVAGQAGEKDYCYGVVDILKNSHESLMYFYSDKGQVQLNSLTVDTEQLCVLVVGCVKLYDTNEVIPYVERLFLRQ